MRAIIVSVDYADLLAVTLPWNRHHFNEVCVVTSTADSATEAVARANGCSVHMTDLFYAHGAAFNKWAALEDGLDWFGRHGWMCLMDADVLWPKNAYTERSASDVLRIGVHYHAVGGSYLDVRKGQLCSPLRRMWAEWPFAAVSREIIYSDFEPWMPAEASWHLFPVHRNVVEWAGYSQILHADDPVLGEPPWHEVDWRHAGGADSFFQARWDPRNKVRPPFEVLHLGPAGVNWHGRATPRLDGTVHPDAKQRAGRSAAIWAERRRRKAEGRDQFEAERIWPGNEKAPPGPRRLGGAD
jgi:hypothetical protein